VNQVDYQVEVPQHAAELHVVNLPSIKQPVANGSYWHIPEVRFSPKQTVNVQMIGSLLLARLA